jgi:CubicO group peptidase (beta-lactamase class C family)
MTTTNGFGTDDTNPSLIRWPEERPRYTALGAAVQGETARWNAIGMAAGVIRGDETETVVAGTANVETGFPLTENALFLIGSISKVYTATLVMRLCEIDVLDLDTPVVTYLPELELASSAARDEITLRHLLSHSAGFEGDRFIDYGRGDDALAKAIAEFGTLTQWYRPGSFFAYCNTGFYLAGRIIEKVTGKPFETVIAEELFEPLGLDHTVILPEYALGRPFATGHKVDRREGVTVAGSQCVPRFGSAAGGIMSSIGDLMRFARMHLNRGELDGVRIISEESAVAMREPFIEADTFHRSYGIGWSIMERPGATSIGHGGAWSGHRANLTIIPEKEFAIAMLVNSDAGVRASTEVQEWALAHYLDVSVPKPDAIVLDDEVLERFTGTFTRHDGRFVVAQRGGGLRITLTDIDEESGEEKETLRIFDLEPVRETRFRVTSPESYGATVDIVPVPDAEGTERELLRMWGRVAARQEG